MDESKLRDLIARWRKAGDQARNKAVDVIFNCCADELERALATPTVVEVEERYIGTSREMDRALELDQAKLDALAQAKVTKETK